MKAIVTLTAGLIFVSTTFAQTSRRSESKEANTQNSNKRSEVSTERRAPSDNSRTETSTTNRRSADTQTSERRTEVHAPAAPSVPSDQDRSSVSNRRGSENQSSERRTEVNNNTPSAPSTNSQDRSSITNRRNPSEQNQGNANNRIYDNNRSQQSRTIRDQVLVQEQARRTVEPRHHTIVHSSYRPVPVEVRRYKNPYRTPVRGEIIWTVDLSRRYEVYYPAYRPYRYHYGMRLATVSAYDAFSYVGDIARVYGRVAETYYSWDTDEYFLYVGDYYPYQDFSVIIPGREARDFSRNPERFFDREYIEVTGLISRFEGKPEMVIKNSSQISVY